jgi:predicted transcriptional regulator
MAKKDPAKFRRNVSLTTKDIPRIRKMLAKGKTQTDIAATFGVSKSCISNIAIGRTWHGV